MQSIEQAYETTSHTQVSIEVRGETGKCHPLPTQWLLRMWPIWEGSCARVKKRVEDCIHPVNFSCVSPHHKSLIF